MNLLDECCQEWSKEAFRLAREQQGKPPNYPPTLAYWPHNYNGLTIKVLANRIIRTRMAQQFWE